MQFGSHSVEECYEKWKVLRGKVRHFRLLREILQDAKAWVQRPWTAPLRKKKVLGLPFYEYFLKVFSP